jgi:hypothetical protein
VRGSCVADIGVALTLSSTLEATRIRDVRRRRRGARC